MQSCTRPLRTKVTARGHVEPTRCLSLASAHGCACVRTVSVLRLDPVSRAGRECVQSQALSSDRIKVSGCSAGSIQQIEIANSEIATAGSRRSLLLGAAGGALANLFASRPASAEQASNSPPAQPQTSADSKLQGNGSGAGSSSAGSSSSSSLSQGASQSNMPQLASTPAPGYGSSSSGSSGASTPAPLGDQALTEEAQRRYMAEEDERRKKRRTFQGRMRELEEIRMELGEKQLALLAKEKELLEKEQTVQVLKDELEVERKLRALLTKEKERAEEESALAMGLCTGGLMFP